MKLEYQVCTLDQAKKLAELLGDDAPGSLWVWIPRFIRGSINNYDLRLRERVLIDSADCVMIPAYTGDEIGILLPKCLNYEESKQSHIGAQIMHIVRLLLNKNFLAYYDYTPHAIEAKFEAHAKAALAIKGLNEGWIKKEDFDYGIS